MPHEWRGSGPLRRGDRDDWVAPGEAFDPTPAEHAAFGDLMVEVTPEDDAAEDDAAEDDAAADTCQVVKADGEVCGRDLPCQYHS